METLLNLRDLLQHEIEDLYSAEEQIIEALPKMVEKSTDRQLKKALNNHLTVTREQKKRLDKIKQLLEKDREDSAPQPGFLERIFGAGTKCKGTEGLIKEGEKMMGEKMDTAVRDAAIIASAQKIEHYEISGYGTARAYAKELGLSEVARLLQATLDEEYSADNDLTALALSKVNVQAEGFGSDVTSRQRPSGNGTGSVRGSKNGQTKGTSANSSRTASKKSAPKKKSSGKKASVRAGR